MVISAESEMARQLSLGLERPKGGRGGVRKGAGRPRVAEMPRVPHDPRPFHEDRCPVHVTYRTVGLRALRVGRVTRALMRSIQRAHKRSFRVVHYSIQTNHIHLIVEADSKLALSRGMQGFAIRAAKAVNRVMGRPGKVWSDRYHAHELRNPREVRNALVYVLKNHARHAGASGVDFWSSGPWFGGWSTPVVSPGEKSPAARPTTWLLQEGWRRAGPKIPIA